jgi:phosphatidylserine/phosphatidylglycerophosphate/cardiolipin synthase-like enzyme
MTAVHVSYLVDAIADAREGIPLPSSLFDLVLSGPDVPGIPTADTAAVMQTLIEEATDNILLIGYAVHNGQRLFKRLAEKMERLPSLRVLFCLDIPRRQADTSLADEIVRRFTEEFKEKHWPGPRLPELYYDPRSLSDSWDKRSSLHAKCVTVDRRVALITSANFTEAAQQRNIEAGVVVRYSPFVERLVGYFEGLRASSQLVRCRF